MTYVSLDTQVRSALLEVEESLQECLADAGEGITPDELEREIVIHVCSARDPEVKAEVFRRYGIER